MNFELESLILNLRGGRVILDSDLARLYGVSTKRLNEQVKRNIQRFPEDFIFQLELQEVTALRSQFATSKGGRRYLPFAFTEHGAVMVANVLNSQVAIEASILLVRTFIKLRSIFSEQVDLRRKLLEIEKRMMQGFANHEEELMEIRVLIAELAKPIEPTKRKIGF